METVYVISNYGENGVKIQAQGYECAEMIGTYALLDRMRELSELNRKENKVALFKFE